MLQQLQDIIDRARHIVIFSHRSPDGDTIGGNLALRDALESWGKSVTSVCADPLPDVYDALDGVSLDFFKQQWDKTSTDLYINVDGSSTTQLVYPEKDASIVDGAVPFISIDHHVSNSYFGTHNLVVPEACSTTYVLYHLFLQLGWSITPRIATYLLLGIYYDTGSLMHSNTTSDVMRVCGELMRLGANRNQIMNVLYRQRTPGQLHAWGKILESVTQNDDGVIMSGITTKDIEGCGAKKEEIGGVVDYLNSVEGAKFAILLSEDKENGIVKGSTRTRRDDVNLSEFCKMFGGGGHKKASGFGITGHLENGESFSLIREDQTRYPQGMLLDRYTF